MQVAGSPRGTSPAEAFARDADPWASPPGAWLLAGAGHPGGSAQGDGPDGLPLQVRSMLSTFRQPAMMLNSTRTCPVPGHAGSAPGSGRRKAEGCREREAEETQGRVLSLSCLHNHT